ncbi:UDP-N-acetylmuramoyl-L-alanyl-D-glutamate--2,6-diaminopimelate ligase [Variovorax sp. PCZ-1]|uniref:UDP-N-acetylmuramoyl-L-alanyl-D-glutamate--2, 6-diaminopimelate ligase n=1 Tax=Variovorax sp. PCZ-1 TaxID=2835533 RepID=UPI001BD1660B|nr:UDP-N-acetylmuramoyl-L-alanyl-D-glutamate--2,6-diaminopimelate ligase [Variovorax sp. PCZ-1]MBS7808147.1 UDP-N-acetylmuramoyl-L-alanyl-D-glutamate--2,6-diaminopimelate ligase [Variovorax sp. PCZ-1]
MMRLETVDQAAQWLKSHVGAGALHTDSRCIKPGDAFIAWPGAATDGRQYVVTSLEAGASCCLVESDGVQAYGFEDARIAQVSGLKAASGLIAAAYYEQPSKALDVLAVTGTNGKTSSAWWIAQSLNTLRKNERSAQYSCGLIGTLGIGTPGNMVSTGLTTPDPVMLQAELARLRDAGASACAMEASSIGIAEHRMAGVQVKVAAFTNFTQDHLDYHGNMEDYWLAKRALFDMPGLETAVINVDDPKGDELMAYCKSRGLNVISTSQIRTDATLCGSTPEHRATGMAFDVMHLGQKQSVSCPVVGDFNAANMLGVIGALLSLGVGLTAACHAVSRCTAVPGRMELIVLDDQPLMVVDYAHTPDALAKALSALRATAQARGGKLWCVFGCGGNRDPLKRPLMAQAVQNGADQIIVTSDNPRKESAQSIASQVMAGFSGASSKIQQELDRRQAIRWAASQAQQEDVILIAGKGHEDYQEIAGIKHPFSDTQEARTALELRTRGEAA